MKYLVVYKLIENKKLMKVVCNIAELSLTEKTDSAKVDSAREQMFFYAQSVAIEAEE